MSKFPEPRFAAGPSDALDCYAGLVKSAHQMGDYVGRPEVAGVKALKTSADYSDYISAVREFPVYFWAGDVSQLIERASASYPLGSELYMPRLARCFCVFQKPTLYMEAEGHTAPLSALSWQAAILKSQNDELTLRVTGYAWVHHSWVAPVWFADIGPKFKPSMSVAPSFWVEQGQFLRWILSAAMFVEQSILVETMERGQKYARRNLSEADLNPQQPCHVIALRKVVRGDAEKDGLHTDVEWSCRWLVRGHWRNQFYPAANRHVPIFISPHIKGPEDKPLREPKPEVFAVTR